MGFKIVHSAINYSDAMAATKSAGNCMGQSCQWAIQLIKGEMQSLMQPCFSAGAALQREYDSAWENLKFFQDGDVIFFRRQAKKVSSSGIKSDIVTRSGASVSLVNSLPSFSGNAAVVIGWRCQDTPSCFSKFGITLSHSGHAVALLRLKNNGVVYLYDPNCGIYEWIPSPGVSLKSDLKQYMLAKEYGVHVRMDGAMMLSTHEDIPANREHVYI